MLESCKKQKEGFKVDSSSRAARHVSEVNSTVLHATGTPLSHKMVTWRVLLECMQHRS
jgi:hypothetical protein